MRGAKHSRIIETLLRLAIFVWLVMMFCLLFGCQPALNYNSVSKQQLRTLATGFKVTGLKVDLKTAERICGEGTAGCLVTHKNGQTIVYTNRETLEHEFNHIVFGPDHEKYIVPLKELK